MATSVRVTDAFKGCSSLEEVRIRITASLSSLSFADSPKISYDSLKYTVDGSTVSFSIIVHANVFSKLTDAEAYPEWYALNQSALSKGITFATA